MKKFYRIVTVILFLSVMSSGCQKTTDEEMPTPKGGDAPKNLGWTATDKPEDVPTSVTNTPIFKSGTLPAKVDLLAHFPPIGDQGQYGTCVAWAAGYNLKTVIDGIQNNWTANQLASPDHQTSPKDLFYSIDDSKKGADCGGTNFTDALDILLTRGVATMQTVPYQGLGDCSKAGVEASWTTEANKRKIKNYRKVEANLNSVKEQLAAKIPVVIGAKLADNFMTWNSDAVFTANTTYNQVGQHAYHALIISGYDDNKGPNGAFKVVNSWGQNWGDVGYIWMDYNFLMKEFVFDENFYIATTDTGDQPPSPEPVPSAGVDLATWVFGDQSTYGVSQNNYFNERTIYYNLYNIGTAAAKASSKWSLYYIYFNAYDANDYGVLFYNEFNTSIAKNTYQQDPQDPNHIICNIDLPANSDFATLAFNSPQLYQMYYTPSNLNGEYYLCLVADGDNAINEQNEQNNFFYTTDQEPKYFEEGYALRKDVTNENAVSFNNYSFKNKVSITENNMKKSIFSSVVNSKNPNAYSSEEIGAMLLQKKKSGDLAKKLRSFKATEAKGGIGGKR